MKLYIKTSEFSEQIKVMNEKVKNSVDKSLSVEKMIDDMGRNISKDIYAAVRKATSNVTKGGTATVVASRENGDVQLNNEVGNVSMMDD